ncbi:hypothetical protein BGZ81_009018 [Podila clonocystis]|nr:hypothetical protein BGZ81_009018 [Podila clonocystis]
MSGRNRSRGAGTTYVNNVRGPTSALTSFLNERGIRRANPAPAPPPPPAPTQGASSSGPPSTAGLSSSSSSATPRPVRSARARAAAAVASAASSSSSRSVSIDIEHMSVDGEDENMISAEDDSSDDDLIPIAIPARTIRAARATRSRVSAATADKSEGSSSKASTSKADAKGSTSSSKKNARKKKMDSSDDSNDEDFHDITGYVSRSKFSHKGRLPQGANKIEFCSRCRARFTVKAGTTPVTDDSGVGLLCATCSGGSSDASAATPKAIKKSSRRKIQKAEIECQIPSLQDLCIQKIAGCIEDVEAFGDISDLSMAKICKIICRNRSLNTDTIQLFLDPRHTELSLYDCTDIEATGLLNIAQFCPKIRSLNLIRCGRILDETINYYTEHLTDLSSLNLSGPFMVTDTAFNKLFEKVGERFRQFCLEHSYRFTLKAVTTLCQSCPQLSRLELGKCTLMDDEWLAPIANLTGLTSLGLSYPKDAGKGLTTEPMVKLLLAVGSGLESLDLEGCVALEDAVLAEAIRPSCVRLERLNISGCEEFTTEGVTALFTDWNVNRGLSVLNLRKCIMLGDDALNAAIAHSHETLDELNINSLEELTKDALVNLSRCENLTKLDVSWVRAMDDEVLERFVQLNLKLEQVVVWGDHRITECCPTRKGLRVMGREGDYISLPFRRF